MEKIIISNFRKVKESWDLDIAPITFLTGTNNSGKSSVLKALMTLSDFSLSKNHLSLAFNGSNARKHKIDCFSNAANWNNDENKNISFEFEHKEYVIQLQYMPQVKRASAIPSRGKLALLKMTRIVDSAYFELKHDGGDNYLLKVDDLFFEKGFNEKVGASDSIELKEANAILLNIENEINKIELKQKSLISRADYDNNLKLYDSKREASLSLNEQTNKSAYMVEMIKVFKFLLRSINHHDTWPKSEPLYLKGIAVYLNVDMPKLKKYLEDKGVKISEDLMISYESFLILLDHFSANKENDSRWIIKDLLDRTSGILSFIEELDVDETVKRKLVSTFEDIRKDLKVLDSYIPNAAQKEKLRRNEQTLNRLRTELEKLKSRKVSEKGMKEHEEKIQRYNKSIERKELDRYKIFSTYQTSIINFYRKIASYIKEINIIESDINNYYYTVSINSEKTRVELDKITTDINNYEKQQWTSVTQKTELDKLKERKKKVQLLIKKLNSEIEPVVNEKDRHYYISSFSESELDTSEPTIDRIVREVLEKYFASSKAKKKEGNIDLKTEINQLAKFGDHIMDVLSFSVNHLSPHRNSQTRLYVNSDTSSDIYELISNHADHPISRNSNAGKFLKQWMRQFDVGVNYRIKSIEGLASIIEIQENEEGKWFNLVDKGFGAGQVFTILLRIAQNIDYKANNTQLILIEEPEANLHPMLQSKLADLFLYVWEEFKIRFIIETHSEYILRKSQVLVKNYPDFDNKPFMVYYFGVDDSPYKMEYRKDGKFIQEFGGGFFDVSSNLAFDIM